MKHDKTARMSQDFCVQRKQQFSNRQVLALNGSKERRRPSNAAGLECPRRALQVCSLRVSNLRSRRQHERPSFCGPRWRHIGAAVPTSRYLRQRVGFGYRSPPKRAPGLRATDHSGCARGSAFLSSSHCTTTPLVASTAQCSAVVSSTGSRRWQSDASTESSRPPADVLP